MRKKRLAVLAAALCFSLSSCVELDFTGDDEAEKPSACEQSKGGNAGQPSDAGGASEFGEAKDESAGGKRGAIKGATKVADGRYSLDVKDGFDFSKLDADRFYKFVGAAPGFLYSAPHSIAAGAWKSDGAGGRYEMTDVFGAATPRAAMDRLNKSGAVARYEGRAWTATGQSKEEINLSGRLVYEVDFGRLTGQGQITGIGSYGAQGSTVSGVDRIALRRATFGGAGQNNPMYRDGRGREDKIYGARASAAEAYDANGNLLDSGLSYDFAFFGDKAEEVTGAVFQKSAGGASIGFSGTTKVAK